MKKILLALLGCLASALSAFDFMRDGKPACVIAVGAEPNRFEKLAAVDLQGMLSQCCGVEFAVVPEAEAKGAAIYVGATEAARQNGCPQDNYEKEEWQILQVGEKLIVTGGRPIGTFYGVWRLLNRLGCYPLTMESMRLPPQKVTFANGLTCRGKPVFNGRAIYDGFPVAASIMGIPPKEAHDYQMWMLRCGLNGRQHSRLLLPLYEGGLVNISTNPPWHTLCVYVNPDQYFASHPEYFSMDEKGNRVRPRTKEAGGSLCMSNPEVQQIAAKRLLEIIRGDRSRLPREQWPVCYDVSLLDLFPYICKCPQCSAIIAEEGGRDFGLLLRFVNQLATKAAEVFPDVQLRTSAYGPASSAIGVKTKPAKNVVIQVADLFVTCDYFRPLAHPLNAAARQKFEQFRDTGAPLLVWDYWNMQIYFEPPRLETVLDTIQPDLRYFASIGVKACFIEGSRHSYKPQNFIDLNYFLASRLMMDTQEDVERLIDIFLEGHYGTDAAPFLRHYLDLLRSAIAADSTHAPGMNVPPWRHQ
ncbi:MAG: DUF4838 domain-containing protein, partial [Victivallales bacterium]|nr:DUF4838 domain-containing protein [Victivallales bacterium]